MNAWTIYWILQLDSINSSLSLAATIATCFTLGLAVMYLAHSLADPTRWSAPENKASAQKSLDMAPGVGKFAVRMLLFAMLPLWTAATLIPSTKTAAAMVVIPAIANNETIRKEAGDLYALAKQALREAVTDEKPKDDTLAGEK